MDFGNRPTTLPETKKLNCKQETEGVANVLTCCSQRPAFQEKRNEKELECEGWRLEPTRFSSWTRLVRLQARVWRVLYNIRSPESRLSGQELLPEEITDAEKIIRRAQQEPFPEEYMALRVGNKFPKKSLLSKLCPRIDDQGVMCCDGRLRFAECLPYDVRFPIILPRGHWVTKLIVKHHHKLANHSAGTNFVVSQISGRFWIIVAHEEIREWENECNECKRRRVKTATQIMALLPQVRLHFTFRAFDQTAVDYAGPFTTIPRAWPQPSEEVVVCIYMFIDSSSTFGGRVGFGHGQFLECNHQIHKPKRGAKRDDQ